MNNLYEIFSKEENVKKLEEIAKTIKHEFWVMNPTPKGGGLKKA